MSAIPITRRAFHVLTAAALHRGAGAAPTAESLRPSVQALLLDWCDALVRLQIDAPSNPAEHGAFRCPSCDFLHGRCSDAVYPLLKAAQLTRSARYRQAAIRVMQWSRNVDALDGSWTNEIDPKSWKGTTVFGAVARAHAIERHGNLLDSSIKEEWGSRLRRAGEFIRKNFDITYGNINYLLTATYALFLLGKMLGETAWQARARELAGQSLSHFTEPSTLIFGEGHPGDRISPLGCRAIDLGYNVEESLPSMIEYSRITGDARVRAAVRSSLRAHLAFMLPDGGWDNSWGTRSFKWTYWGSRTSDGAMPAMLALAGEEPGFGAAAEQQLALLRRCTVDGLLHGGPHLAARGAKPCVHHTFTHAKALADVLDSGPLPARASSMPLPRASADGIRFFPEIATWLAARGPWRATVTRNDWMYQPGVWHPTGGAISMLYHRDAGPLLAGSMASYRRVEPNNMQMPPDAEDYPLTPRVDRVVADQLFSTLYDLHAQVRTHDERGTIDFDVEGELCNSSGASSGGRLAMSYRISSGATQISVSAPSGSHLAIPLIALNTEAVQRTGPDSVCIAKAGTKVRVQASGPIQLRDDGRSRIFNLVPGFLAVPVVVPVTTSPVTCTIQVA